MRPEIIDEYRTVCEQSAILEKEKKRLRPEVLKLIEETDGWDDCYIQSRKQTKYVDENILAWIKKDYPQLYDKIVEDRLNWDAFESFLNLQEIDIRTMPPNCWYEINQPYIMTNKRKVKKDED